MNIHSLTGRVLDKPLLMGIVNVTPDSFSDGGLYNTPEAAIAHARKLIAEGADILDIGGESTRPGAEPISLDEELRRVIPVIRELAKEDIKISIDTRHAAVMAAALEAGAHIINDVTALTGDKDSIMVAAQSKSSIVLMHMQGQPKNMQQNPTYEDVVADLLAYFRGRLAECQKAGISLDRLWIDPGIGFGKNLQHNIKLLQHLSAFRTLGCGMLLGVSRKSFIGQLSHNEPVSQRLGGSIAAVLAGLEAGVSIFRVHDVAATRQAIAVWQAIKQ